MYKILFIGLFLISSSFISDKSRVKAWTEDIDFYQQMLEQKHLHLYHKISKKNFDLRIKKIKANISKLTDFQLIVELMKLTRKIGDGHTSVPLWNRKRHYYPIEFFDFNGNWRVLGVSDKYAGLTGKKLISIDEVPTAEVSKKVGEVAQFVENKQSLMQRATSYAKTSEVLHALGITQRIKKASFKFVGEDNKTETVIIDAVPIASYNQVKFKRYAYKYPDLSRPATAKLKNTWFKPLPDKKTVYVKFRRFVSIEQMDKLGQELLRYINTHGIKNLIIDMRENYGGNFFAGLKLAENLVLADGLNWEEGIYVISGRGTFSAAMSNTVQFRQILNAKVVGEPTGANPAGFQDMGQFKLPNSKLVITYSKRLYSFQAKVTQGVQPDKLITPQWKYYKQGIDEVMRWILDDLK